MISSPYAVALSLKCLEYSQSSSNYIDYSLLSSSITTTGFNVDIKINQVFTTVTYNKMIINYWTNTNISRLVCYSVLPVNPTISSSGGNTNYTWYFQDSYSVVTSTIYSGCSFITELIANYVGGKFQTLRSIFELDGSMKFKIIYTFLSTTTINSIKLSSVIFDYNHFNYPNYTISLLYFSSTDPIYELEYLDSLSYVSIVLGLEYINSGSTVSNKLGWYFGF